MLIEQKESNVEVFGGLKSSKMAIQNSGKMFNMIMSGLYSDPHTSITREIWANAFDAHVEVGNEGKPFDVVMPSRFKPEFTVRDYGPGLSDDYMNNYYTVLGYSTKESTNEAVGKWGVGRMSPMAYTDTFTVTSIHKHMKAVYNVVKDANGEPQLNTFIAPHHTDEANGLQISFPVKSEDIFNFVNAAKRVSLGFEVKPNVIGQPDFEWPKFTIGVDNGNYAFYESSLLRGPVAQMGCVLYPIKLQNVGNQYSNMGSANVLLRCPIGSLEVTASREDLSYGPNDPTIGTLSKTLDEVVKSFVKDAQKILDSSKPLIERLCDYYSYTTNIPYYVKAQTMELCKLEGVALKNLSLYFPLAEFWNNQLHISKKPLNSLSRTKLNILVGYKGGPKGDKYLHNRVREYVKSSHSCMFYVVFSWDKKSKEYVSDFSLGRLEEVFGKNRIKFASDLPAFTPVNSGKKTGVKVKDCQGCEKEVDFSDGGFYINTYAGNPIIHYGAWQLSVNELLSFALNEGVINSLTDVAFVPATLKKKVEDNSKWVNFESYMKDYVTKNKGKLEAAYKNVLTPCTYSSILLEAGAKSPVASEVTIKQKGKTSVDSCNLISKVLKVFNLMNLPILNGYEMSQKSDKEVLSTYPMLKYFRYSDKKEFVEYVKLVDKSLGY